MIHQMLCLSAFLAVMGSLAAASLYEDNTLLVVVTVAGVLFICLEPTVTWYLAQNVLRNKSIAMPCRKLHDERRYKTYPSPVTNTWYHFCDSSQLKNGEVMEYRALGRVFVLWRDELGKPVCQDAFCIHQGANLGVGGKVVDNCLQCPFHKWKFTSDGTIQEVPYLMDPTACQSLNRKQKTYHCMDWCGWLLVYFHADECDPEFYPPTFVPNELREGSWAPHLKWDVGFFTFSPVDIVDQAGDHAHFQTLHSEFMLPWTKIPLPGWLHRFLPLGIAHTCITYRGDDKEWAEEVQRTGWGVVDKRLLFFTDLAGLTWQGKAVESTLSQTKEMYIGPALMVFHIPFTLGTMKIFVSTTPVDGGSILRVRTWVDARVASSLLLRCIAFLLTGISASQLNADVDILENKIRLRKPLVQPFDGPYNRTNAWLKLFYSKGSPAAGPIGCEGYKNDW